MTTSVTLHWLNLRLLIVVVTLTTTVSLLVSLGTVLLVQSEANRAVRVGVVNSCDGANLLRGFARLATHRGTPTLPDDHNLADWLLRIRDCEATYDTGHVVVIAPVRELAYLRLLAHRQRVAVRDGGATFKPLL